MEYVCPKCKVILAPREDNENVFLDCNVCGYSREFRNWVPHECPKCKCEKAIVLRHVQMIGDEDTTTLFRCIRCGATDKEGFMG